MRSISINRDNTGYAIGGIEGRVGIEYFTHAKQASEGSLNEYVFKCHRHKVGSKEKVYPINSIVHHPIYGTFATGGCDGYVIMWDGFHRKRLTQFPEYPTRFADSHSLFASH